MSNARPSPRSTPASKAVQIRSAFALICLRTIILFLAACAIIPLGALAIKGMPTAYSLSLAFGTIAIPLILVAPFFVLMIAPKQPAPEVAPKQP